jgi:signal transduction histidine kinase
MVANRHQRLATYNPFRKDWTWRLAGIWMVALALSLATIGIIVSWQQAGAITQRLMGQTETLAELIAAWAEQKLDDQLESVFEHFGSQQPGGPPSALRTPVGERLPAWIQAVYSVQRNRVSVAFGNDASAAVAEALQPVETRLSAPEGAPAGKRPELIHGAGPGGPLVLLVLYVAEAAGDPRAVVLNLNTERLRSDLIEPLIPPDGGLEVVAAGRESPAWSRRLPGAMRSWALRPAEAFIREQRRGILWQTAVSLGLTSLGLLIILAAMWTLFTLVRREVALAEMKANFVADVSHELKTPLALIHMFAETLQSGRVVSDDKRREYYEIIMRESTRLTNLINNILDFARIDAGRREYRMEPTDLAEVVRDTYEAYRGQLDHHGFEHHLAVEPDLPLVRADRDAIAQALINLIHNAVKYSSEERYLGIDVAGDTRRGRHGVLISVHDRGIGIRPEDRARIFEGFFRSPDGRVREQTGTGLGLSLVKHIVESHGGILDVESRLVKGTTFRIFLPAVEQAERIPTEASRAAAPSEPTHP